MENKQPPEVMGVGWDFCHMFFFFFSHWASLGVSGKAGMGMGRGCMEDCG